MSKKIKQTSIPAQSFTVDLDKLSALVAADKRPAIRIPVESVDKGLHTLALNMVKAEGSYDKALNAVYTTFKLYALAALPIIARVPAHTAALHDLRAVYGEARKPAAIQRVTMLNNMRTIAYGKDASRDTVAQSAQGVECVIEALNTATSLPALKAMLSAMKLATHASQGVPKTVKVDAHTKGAPVKPTQPEQPTTRGEAIKAACRMLKFISETFLKAGSENDLVLEIADVIEHLQAKAA